MRSLNNYSFQIFSSTQNLPSNWNNLAAHNIFLTTNYLEVLEESAPHNMVCHFIGIFDNDILVGIALSQFLDLNGLATFGMQNYGLKTVVRNMVFRNFASHVLFIGNNMLTGQNAYAFSSTTDISQALKTLKFAGTRLKKMFKTNIKKKIHITTFKDFNYDDQRHFDIVEFKNNYRFSTQPSMVFKISLDWKSEQDYVDALSKKYRDQYKRARKKSAGVLKKKMNLAEIIENETTIYDLYLQVAKNAPFNTFFLTQDHFRVFKEKLQDSFLFYGYFFEEKLIGFNTMIKNGGALDTYFLGYDDNYQRDKMLYLNMLYDMVAFAIKKGYKEVIFARTALEIKSSVGAIPVNMYGYIEHEHSILNRYMDKIFTYLEPETAWHQRHPFR